MLLPRPERAPPASRSRAATRGWRPGAQPEARRSPRGSAPRPAPGRTGPRGTRWSVVGRRVARPAAGRPAVVDHVVLGRSLHLRPWSSLAPVRRRLDPRAPALSRRAITWTSMPDSAAKRRILRTTEPRVSSSQRLRRLAPTTIWVIWCSLGELDHRSGRVVAGDLVPRPRRRRPTSRRHAPRGPGDVRLRLRRRWRRGRTRRSPFTRWAMRAARRTTPSLPGAPVTATMIRSAVSQTAPGCWVAR